MDGGNREEEVLRQGSGLVVASSTSPQSPYSTPCHDNIPTQFSPSRQYSQHENHPYYDLSADSYPSKEPLRPDLHDSPTDASSASYAANNLQAVASNATVPARGGASTSPDNYYRMYRGVETVNNHLVSPTTHDPMASAVTNNRQPLASRSNSNASSSKLPATTGSRTGNRPMYRSASNPVDDSRFSGNDASVKDMKKRFEQQKGPLSSAEPRRAISRTGTKDGAANGVNVRPAPPNSQSYSSLRTTGSASTKPSPSRGTQRSKFTAEDQVSTNSQSFASRINRPKGSLASSAHSTKSMTHISPTSSLNQESSPLEPAPGGSLLFGEIRQEDLNAETPGYGIEGRPRRLSESATQNPMWQHQRSQSDAVVEPASPTDWYRGAGPTHKNGVSEAGSVTKGHSRSHSEIAAAKLPTINTNAQFRKRLEQTPSPHPSSPSRLPISGVKAAKHSDNTCEDTRDPVKDTNDKRWFLPQNSSTFCVRFEQCTACPVSEASTAASRLRTAGRSRSPHKNAVRLSARPESRQETPSSRRRKLSLGGPVDFAERRETIKLKYTKSIRETEAARNAAAEKRKKELEAAAKAKARAKARVEAQAAAAAEAAAAQTRGRGKLPDVTRRQEPQTKTEHEAEPTGELPLVIDVNTPHNLVRAHAPALVVDSPTLGLPGGFPSYDSPPVDGEEAPPSAISETSAVTEFDNEAQTEPPVPEDSAQAVVSGVPDCASSTDSRDHLAPQLTPTPVHEKAMYRDPFEDIVEGDSVSIKIALEPSSPRHQTRDSLISHEPEIEPSIPGAFTETHETESDCESQHCSEHQSDTEAEPQAVDDRSTEPQKPRAAQEDEYEPQPYLVQPYHTTTVTIISRDSGIGPSTYAEQGSEKMLQQQEPRAESLEEYFSRPQLRDNVSSLRDSTFTASDAGTSDGPSGSADMHHTPDTSNSLNVPSMMTPANRSSQHSVWTDISYSSRDSRRLDYLDEQRYGGADESRPQSVRDDESTYRRRYFAGEFGLSKDEDAQSENRKYRILSELDTSYIGSRAPYVPRLPDHSPPPPPETASRPNSMYYDGHRPSSSMTRDDQGSISFPLSRRESEEYHHNSSSPQSLDGRSLATDSATLGQTLAEGDSKISGDADEKAGPVVKKKNRLHQRQMVIKELVDTEAVFVRDMNVVEEIYKGTAEACPRLDDKTIKLIFRNTHEIVAFHTTFLSELKDGVTSVYMPKGRRSPVMKEDTAMSDVTTVRSFASTATSTVPSTAASSTTAVSLSGTTATNGEPEDAQDRQTVIGPAFIRNIEQMRAAHEGFLRTSDVANKRLIEIQEDPTVKVWLNECNEVAKDLTAAWNLDSLLIKPMQRITKYPNLISQLLEYTPEDHPDREGLVNARATVETAILEINKTKKNFELVGQIVGRKRKESDVKAGFARAFGKRVDKLQASGNRPPEDPEYLKHKEKFNDDYVRLQVVLRDVEFYTRQVSTYVQAFLDYLSAIELVTRLQPGPYPELESKWVQFNVSMRDIKKVALDQHLLQIRKHVIEPFEFVIQSYQNPLLAMKKRNKRRLDYEKSIQVKKGGKKMDKQLTELVEHYEALNDTLNKELPQLSALTEKVGNICLGNMINIQARWWFIWKEKIRGVAAMTEVPEVSDIVSTFHRDFKDMEEQIQKLSLLNPASRISTSQSIIDDGTMSRSKSRPSDVGTPRSRGLSVTSDVAPILPTPDFQRTGQLTMSPPAATSAVAGPSGYFYRDYYSGLNSRGPASPTSSDFSNPPRSIPAMGARPGTGRSFDSAGMTRPSIDTSPALQARRDSNSTNNATPSISDGNRGSGLFHSALPMAETADEPQRSSRASSRERYTPKGYNILWLAASLFEFNIETTKHEAGYPYLTYQAGEIFDVIAEKGELWLAKNQDDPSDLVGWIWSKHFAKLADS
ncbi:hypothetical protein VSDG_04703 [Cytospora chrysosperma]|uniref:DH domain-containing protein n=1 Tax=Cytospora chrysosperma TaxID=252740 RepID=A0A423W214_CYTCH|nr:hypothetical protein VSDG_04703 [Valsa sordida]